MDNHILGTEEEVLQNLDLNSNPYSYVVFSGYSHLFDYVFAEIGPTQDFEEGLAMAISNNLGDIEERYVKDINTMNIALNVAVENNNQEKINHYMKLLGENVDYRCLFVNACCNNNFVLMNSIINSNNFKEDFYISGFGGACHHGSYKMVKFLFPYFKGNINTALKLACDNKSKKIIKFLIKNGANDFNSGLKKAAKYGIIWLVKLFVKLGATNITEALNVCEPESKIYHFLSKKKF